LRYSIHCKNTPLFKRLYDGINIEFEHGVPWAIDQIIVYRFPIVFKTQDNRHDHADGGAIDTLDILNIPISLFVCFAENAIEREPGLSAAGNNQMPYH
jgi:hypothetical protein